MNLKKLTESLADKVKERTTHITTLADEVNQKNSQLVASYEDTIRVFISLINMNKELSSNHAHKAADLFAESLNLPEEVKKQLYYFAGLLHEQDTLSLPDSIIEPQEDTEYPTEKNCPGQAGTRYDSLS